MKLSFQEQTPNQCLQRGRMLTFLRCCWTRSVGSKTLLTTASPRVTCQPGTPGPLCCCSGHRQPGVSVATSTNAKDPPRLIAWGVPPGCGFWVTCIPISETLRRRDSRDGNALFHEGSQECVIFQEHDRSPRQRGKGTKTHGAGWEAVAAMPARADGACPGGGRRRRSSKPT